MKKNKKIVDKHQELKLVVKTMDNGKKKALC